LGSSHFVFSVLYFFFAIFVVHLTHQGGGGRWAWQRACCRICIL